VVGVTSYAAPAKALLPAFLLVPAFLAGMHLAADCLAGERERGSLEPLLLNPVPPLEMAAGKWLAITGLSLAGVALTLICTVVMANIAPLRAPLGPATLLWMLVTLAPLACLFSGVQLLVSAWSRTSKEAESYFSLLLLFPMLTGILAEFFPVRLRMAVAWVPILGQQRMLSALVRGEVPQFAWILAAGSFALLASAGAVMATARLLKSEKVVFGR
jgi:sodium transport system permease protein